MFGLRVLGRREPVLPMATTQLIYFGRTVNVYECYNEQRCPGGACQIHKHKHCIVIL